MPPKLPQPRTMRETPAVVASTARFYERLRQDGRVFTCPPPPPPQLPPRDRPHYELTIRVEPGFERVNGDLTVRFTPSRATDRTTLVISYGIAAHETVTAHMTWRLRVPPGTRDRISRSQGVLRLC